MKIFTIMRTQYLKDRTLGTLYVNGEFLAYTLEDAARPVKIPGETCIQPGVYKLVRSYSPRFKRDTPRLLDVPGFGGILMHGGNTPDHTAGCILVAHSLLQDGRIQGTAEADVLAALGGDQAVLCIMQAPNFKL